MRTLSLLFFSLFCIIGSSQTKLISHKSHSGSDKNFRIALEENLFDIGDSNFGRIEMHYNEYYETLDTIIKISKNKVVSVKSQYYQVLEKSDKSKVGNLKYSATRRDTVFVKNLKSISNNELENLMKTDEKNTIYINFDKVVIVSLKDKQKKDKQKRQEKRKEEKKSAFPIMENDNNFPSKPLLILTLLLLSSLVAFFSWKTSRFKTIVS